MANTTIQILRSYANTAPLTLADGELAFSFVSNQLFIGNSNNAVIPIAGNGHITQVITETLPTEFDGGSF